MSLFLIIDNGLQKNHESVVELFDKVISIKKIEKENVNLIKIKKALFLSNHYGEEEILKVLNPIINSDSIWRSSAIKILIEKGVGGETYEIGHGRPITNTAFLKKIGYNKELPVREVTGESTITCGDTTKINV